MRKTEKPIHAMPSVIAVLNIPMNMTVLTNVSMASTNTTDGSDITKRKRENVNISDRVVRRSKNNEGM